MNSIGPARARPVGLTRSSGFWTLLLAGLHLATTTVFYGESVRSIVDAGVLGAVDEDASLATLRGAGFWYVTVGVYLGLVGLMVMRAERRGDGVPRGFTWVMAATGVWGALLSPASGFWLFLPIAGLARRNTVGRACSIARRSEGAVGSGQGDSLDAR
jgi:hypothetical protein